MSASCERPRLLAHPTAIRIVVKRGSDRQIICAGLRSEDIFNSLAPQGLFGKRNDPIGHSLDDAFTFTGHFQSLETQIISAMARGLDGGP